ncbi:MAG: hypothetical protein KatS3mg082_3372 [Nitrospiraceae bacterium]|nr:MAG: hypothetical protein KatS3mg051_1837 [Anaerolineae bacterium]GIW56968.1 MAG: hypothetical protein KatS3mg082_3372 [Nitrospiraceae bacterium]
MATVTPGIWSRIERLISVEASLKALEAEREELRDAIRRFMADTGNTVLHDDVNGYTVRLQTRKRRNIDASKVPDDLLLSLAKSKLVSIKAAAADAVPPEAVTIETQEVLVLQEARS